MSTSYTNCRWEKVVVRQTLVTSKHRHKQLSISKAAAKLLSCLLHHFLSNLHSLLLLLHKEELAYVPSSLTADREAEVKYGKCSPQVNRTMIGKDGTACVCVCSHLSLRPSPPCIGEDGANDTLGAGVA